MFRIETAQAVGGYGNFKNAEDWDLWLRMGLRGKFHNIQEYFVRYLMTETSKTFVFKHSQSQELMRVIRAHRGEYPGYAKAWAINASQYCFSLLPLPLRRFLYSSLSSLKRSL
jgi:hypothetical protein